MEVVLPGWFVTIQQLKHHMQGRKISVRKEIANADLHPWMCAWCGTRPTLRKELLCESCAEYLYFYIWNTFSKRSRWMRPEDWEG
jgi:hypothetical protein